MSRSNSRRITALCLSLAGAPLGAAAVPADEGSSETVRDFMIQNVCIDGAGGGLDGISPIDGDRRCVAQRDLMPGEKLPYHKHDHPSPRERTGVPRGYQRHDSFPVETAQFGMVVEHSFDFGAGGGRQFGVFDAGRGDGGDVTLLSPQAASFIATEDGGAGFQLFVGPDCRDQVGAAALARSWIITLLDPNQTLRGETVARLNGLKEGRQSTCPARLNAAFTRWYIQPVRFRAGDGQGPPVTLTTLISEHYGGEQPETADHVERFYFTRELGSTRWERWQNLSRSRDFSADQVAKAASDLAVSGRCSKADTPLGGAPLLMIDCREWTLVLPADNPKGDRPGFFIDAVRSRGLADDLFAAPGARERSLDRNPGAEPSPYLL
jgi:hypothetical protein